MVQIPLLSRAREVIHLPSVTDDNAVYIVGRSCRVLWSVSLSNLDQYQAFALKILHY